MEYTNLLLSDNEEKDNRIRQIPKSQYAEQALLGSLMLNNQNFELIEGKIHQNDFFYEANRQIFIAMMNLNQRMRFFDYAMIITELNNLNKLEEAGGEAYVKKIWQECPSFGDSIHFFASTVRDKAILRELIKISGETIDEAFENTNKPTIELLENAERKVFQLSNQFRNEEQGGAKKAQHIAMDTVNYIKFLAETGSNITGISTGFNKIDEMTAGLQPGDLIIVGGRPSMGKTTFAMNIGENIALKGQLPVLIFSLEMPARSLMMRLFSSQASIPLNNLRKGKLENHELVQLKNVIRDLTTAPLFIDDGSVLTVSELRARARRIHREQGKLGLILIDYLQLMQPERGSTENRTNQMSEISRNLKLLAKELNVPIIALSQLNRASELREDKRPLMSDIRDSGAIEQDADVIMFVYRDDYQNKKAEGHKPSTAEIIIGKQRNGEIGTVYLEFQGYYSRFVDRKNQGQMPEYDEGDH